MVIKDEVSIKIDELRQKLPPYWIDVIAMKMQRKASTIYAYANGTRGKRKGKQKEVLRLLIALLDIEKNKDKTLLS